MKDAKNLMDLNLKLYLGSWSLYTFFIIFPGHQKQPKLATITKQSSRISNS